MDRRRRFRRVQDLPEHSERLCEINVNPRIISRCFPSRFHPLAVAPFDRAPPSAMADALLDAELVPPCTAAHRASGVTLMMPRRSVGSLATRSPVAEHHRNTAAAPLVAAVARPHAGGCNDHHWTRHTVGVPANPPARPAVAGNGRPAIAAVHCLAPAISRRLTHHYLPNHLGNHPLTH